MMIQHHKSLFLISTRHKNCDRDKVMMPNFRLIAARSVGFAVLYNDGEPPERSVEKRFSSCKSHRMKRLLGVV